MILRYDYHGYTNVSCVDDDSSDDEHHAAPAAAPAAYGGGYGGGDPSYGAGYGGTGGYNAPPPALPANDSDAESLHEAQQDYNEAAEAAADSDASSSELEDLHEVCQCQRNDEIWNYADYL